MKNKDEIYKKIVQLKRIKNKETDDKIIKRLDSKIYTLEWVLD